MMRHAVAKLDAAVAALTEAAGWLVLPVSVLLFLQWPLREWMHAFSREANDLAQWLFALYVAAALTQATRLGSHLGTPGLSARLPPAARRRVVALGGAVCVLPWAGFIAVAAAPQVWQSIVRFEAFSETTNPGYWIVKLAAWLLALLAICQALLDIGKPR